MKQPVGCKNDRICFPFLLSAVSHQQKLRPLHTHLNIWLPEWRLQKWMVSAAFAETLEPSEILGGLLPKTEDLI